MSEENRKSSGKPKNRGKETGRYFAKENPEATEDANKEEREAGILRKNEKKILRSVDTS